MARWLDSRVLWHCIIQSVCKWDLKKIFTEESGLSREQRTYIEQLLSSPMEILNVFKILLLKQYLNPSKWLCELQMGEKAVSLTMSISNELLPHPTMGRRKTELFCSVIRFQVSASQYSSYQLDVLKGRAEESVSPTHPSTHRLPHSGWLSLEITFIGQLHLR